MRGVRKLLAAYPNNLNCEQASEAMKLAFELALVRAAQGGKHRECNIVAWVELVFLSKQQEELRRAPNARLEREGRSVWTWHPHGLSWGFP